MRVSGRNDDESGLPVEEAREKRRGEPGGAVRAMVLPFSLLIEGELFRRKRFSATSAFRERRWDRSSNSREGALRRHHRKTLRRPSRPVNGLRNDHESAIPSGSVALERLRLDEHEKAEKAGKG
jgi:hypothetical protein